MSPPPTGTTKEKSSSIYSEKSIDSLITTPTPHHTVSARGEQCILGFLNLNLAPLIATIYRGSDIWRGDIPDSQGPLCMNHSNPVALIVALTIGKLNCLLQNLPGSHALLLGSKGTGRKSLLKLMAYIKKSNVKRTHMCVYVRVCMREL